MSSDQQTISSNSRPKTLSTAEDKQILVRHDDQKPDKQADSEKLRAGKSNESGASTEEREQKPPVYKRPKVILISIAIFLVLTVSAIIYWLHARQFEATDDAYIDGHITQISPQIPALVAALHITDNQLVAKGDLLVELHPTDYQVALEQSQAQSIAAQGRSLQAQAQTGASKAAVVQTAAAIDAAQVSFDNAARDLKQYEEVDPRARSQQQLDSALAAAKSAQAELEQAKARRLSAEANVATSEAAVKAAEGELRTAAANVKRAEVSLADCRIYAPSPGRVTQRTIEAGAYVQTGQAMFSLVAPNVWITANYKETQLKRMRPGLPVSIRVDAFPSRRLRGHVDSIQAGSGSRFSLLPAENATGNFVKVVQRFPVKILFDEEVSSPGWNLLSPGMSVVLKVKVR